MYKNNLVESEKAQNKSIKRFNSYLKENEKNILSINELTDKEFVITFKNKSVFKFKWFLPIEKIPAFKIGKWNNDNKIKKLF